ncbi:hypothetical protein ACFE04_024214 [Oxalis oulophora]
MPSFGRSRQRVLAELYRCRGTRDVESYGNEVEFKDKIGVGSLVEAEADGEVESRGEADGDTISKSGYPGPSLVILKTTLFAKTICNRLVTDWKHLICAPEQ